MSTPIHIRMKELELGEISKPGSRSIPIIHEDDVSGLRREPKEKKMLYFYKFKYEIQTPNGSSTSFITKEGEKDIHIKCIVGLSKNDIDELAIRKLESSFMSNERVVDSKILFKKRVF